MMKEALEIVSGNGLRNSFPLLPHKLMLETIPSQPVSPLLTHPWPFTVSSDREACHSAPWEVEQKDGQKHLTSEGSQKSETRRQGRGKAGLQDPVPRSHLIPQVEIISPAGAARA
jgi:hypothetical protein